MKQSTNAPGSYLYAYNAQVATITELLTMALFSQDSRGNSAFELCSQGWEVDRGGRGRIH